MLQRTMYAAWGYHSHYWQWGKWAYNTQMVRRSNSFTSTSTWSWSPQHEPNNIAEWWGRMQSTSHFTGRIPGLLMGSHGCLGGLIYIFLYSKSYLESFLFLTSILNDSCLFSPSMVSHGIPYWLLRMQLDLSVSFQLYPSNSTSSD